MNDPRFFDSAAPAGRRFLAVPALLALVALVGCGAGQATSGPASSPEAAAELRGLDTPPVYSLLGYRETLELTSEQITRIDSIGSWIDSANRGLRPGPAEAQRRQGSGGFFGGQGRGPAATPEAQAAMDSLRANNRAAVQALEQVLTEEQRARVCELNRPDRQPPAGRRGAASAPDRRGQGGMTVPMGGRYVWPWCAPPSPPEGGPAPEAT
jgi:hypothetical protein